MSCKATINEVLLRFGFIRPDVPVQDAAGTPPKPSKTTQSLQAHDKQYHPNGWKPGDKCRLRDSIFNVDDLGSPTTGQGQQQTQQGSQGQTTQAAQPNNLDFPTESEFETVIGLVNANPRLVPPMLKQALDDLPKKIFDLAENQEYLDDAIADLPDGDAKNSLLADQQDLEKERMKLRGEFLQTYRVLSSILGTKKPEALTRNPALKHDPSQFPTTLDTTPTVNSDGSVDISFDGTSYHFTPCANGSTGPVEGTITINGQPKQFILKLSNKAGIRHPVPPEALKNEQAASEMLRKAGLNAPDAMVFEKNGQVYRLAEKIEPSTGLDQTPITQDIQRQLREAYPLLDLMYSHDAFRNDNIRVDQNGKVWFVDNGSAFAFKGYGDKKSASNPNWKGFDFEQRNDADGQPLQGSDGNGGQKMYPAHYGALYESQKKIQKYLGQVTQKDLLKEASRYNMTALVAGLPKESKCQALEAFAASLDKLSAKAAGTRKVKSSLKPQKPQPAQGQATGQNQAATTSQGNGASQQQAPASTGSNTTLTSGTTVPPALNSLMHNLSLPGIPNSAIDNNGNYLYSISMINGASNPQALQTLANNLPHGMSVTTHSNGNAYIINTADYQNYWSNYNHKIVQPQIQASGGSTAPGSTTPSPSQATSSSQPAMTTISSFNGTLQIPTSVAMVMTNNMGVAGLSSSTTAATNAQYVYSHQPYASNTADTMAQQAANQLSANSGYTVFTYGAGTGQKRIGIIQGGPASIPGSWGATIFKPQGQTVTPASTTSSKPSPAASKSSQQQPVSKPASTPPSSSSSSSASATSAPKFTYGSAGSLVKSGGFNDGNIATDVSSLISATGLQSAKGKMLLAAGTKLKTQGSIANNGDLYIGLPAGIKKSDIQAIANHLNNEYGQYGYSAYPMGGSWISIEPTKQNTMKPNQAATVSAASTPKPAQTSSSAQNLNSSQAINKFAKQNGFTTNFKSTKTGGYYFGGQTLSAANSLINSMSSKLPSGYQIGHIPTGNNGYSVSIIPPGGARPGGFVAGQVNPSTASATASSTPTPATSQMPPPASTSTQTATTNPGGAPTSQPASTTVATSNQTTGQTSATPTAQTAVPPPPRKTLSQMIQQRLASANPQQQARFQAALNRANGNSGIPPQPQTTQGASQQPQTASQTSGQPTTPSGQQSQQTASTTLLTAPKSGNQPTPAQQKTIARFQQQIQNARTPTQKAAFQQALSRYFGAI